MATVLVIGGSLGGLLAANMLWRDGHEVRVLERTRGSMSGRGAGIVTHDALHAALLRAGIASDTVLGVPVPGRVLLAADGSTCHELSMPQMLTSWSRLYDLLRAALPAHLVVQGVSVARTDADAQAVAAHGLQDGKPQVWSADLLIACDGIRSTVRQQLFPHIQAPYAGYVAWRGVCDEALLSPRTLSSLFPYFGFGLSEREQIIGYPVAGAHNTVAPGGRAYNFVWYRPTEAGAALDALMTDADGQHHAQGIPPHLVATRHIDDMRQAAREQLAPQWAEVVEKTGQPFLQPIHDLASERLCEGRIALLGDAAFVARPHLGMGVTKAAQDAVALSQALRQHGATPQALRAYESQRLPAGQPAVARGRWLGAFLEGAALVDRQERERQAIHETAVDPARYLP